MTPQKPNKTNLNSKQWQAVVSENKFVLVLAGAGSGKTKTLLHKIKYLVEEKGVKPSAILAITFTKNAANEMIDRLLISADATGEYEQLLSQDGISIQEKIKKRKNQQQKYKWIDRLTIKTFHGFCYNTLYNHGVTEFDNKFKIIGNTKGGDNEFISNTAPETVFEATHKMLIEQCEDSQYLLLLKRYILDYIVEKVHLQEEEKQPREGKYYITLDGTEVRSKSEQFIADWLYRHNIKYEYEPKVNIGDFDFHPDFFLPEANIFLEHVSSKSYPTKNKEEQFKKAGIRVVKTFESMATDSRIFNQELDKIIKNSLPSNHKHTLTLNYKEEFNGYHENVKVFIKQIIRITDMIKVDNTDLEKVLKAAEKDPHERIRYFYRLAGPIIKAYRDYCIDKSYLDFNDLISRTISLFENAPDTLNYYKKKYQYILVDEFQDVNNLQVQLIKRLLTNRTQLFCVGDDWQSIYGFRGSNVNYIVKFEKHFPGAELVKLNLNYRSGKHIVQASNDVIGHNLIKVKKEIKSSRDSEEKVVVYCGNCEEENVKYCIQKVKQLLQEGIAGEDILFLYRVTKMRRAYVEGFNDEGISVQFKTIHASKGLEAKAVFILGLTEPPEGFPFMISEDRIYAIVRPPDYDLLLEEERRLFYVSITRAKDKLFLITEKGSESSFLKEISEEVLERESLDHQRPIKPILLCQNCAEPLQETWVVCPHCELKTGV